MICPFMSRPVMGEDGSWWLAEVLCRMDCAAWAPALAIPLEGATLEEAREKNQWRFIPGYCRGLKKEGS